MPKIATIPDMPEKPSLLSSIKNPTKRLDNTHLSPLWKGPKEDGITFSMLSRYLVCKERFRVYALEGIRTAEQFNHKIEYGNMWHICEEAFAKGVPWQGKLDKYYEEMCKKYQYQQDQVDKWVSVCAIQFPRYVKYWADNEDVKNLVTLEQEKVFDIPYLLPSGRIVRLRGKRDRLDILEGKKLYLQENKTKGDIDEFALGKQLSYDLQTNMYLTGVYQEKDEFQVGKDGKYIAGVRYNVIRRPLSGGKGTIVQHKPSKKNPQGETKEEYYNRLAAYIDEEPETYFMRWKVDISEAEVKKFQRECLNPVLENICDDYEWWDYCFGLLNKYRIWDSENRHSLFPNHCPRHFRYPYGIFNPLDDGGMGDVDEYLRTGSLVGLRVVDKLFEELT